MAKPYPYFVSLDEARNICHKNRIPVSIEEVSLDNFLNRIVAENVIAKVNDPPFDNSAMDGFAVKFSDTKTTPTTLKIVKMVAAGKNTPTNLAPGQAVKIMTGAPIPNGADSIIPIEKCTIKEDLVILSERSKPHFIRKKGENFTKGSVLFNPGECLTAEKISLCASAGVSKIEVYKKLKIAIISTGDELKIPGDKLEYGEIYESNSYGILSLIELFGHKAIRFPNVIDNIEKLRGTLNEAAKKCDLIITSGGVSMGDRDFVRKIMEEEGEIKFWRVKIRPGSPPIFGLWNNTPIFGLPGNPVSSHVVFHSLVYHWLSNLTKTKPKQYIIQAILADDIKTVDGFTTFRRVELFYQDSIIYARLKGHQGSGNMAGMAMSDGLTILEPNSSGEKGSKCKILLL